MKYKLLKEYPGLKTGDIIDTDRFLNVGFTQDPGHYPDFFEPIVEKKTIQNTTLGELYCITRGGYTGKGCTYADVMMGNAFLTREEAEDEHKRREWAVRKEKFIPKIGDECWEYSTYSEKPVWDYYGRGGNNTILSINLGLVFRTKEDCQDAIDNHDLIRLFYTIR